jgi:hypothetical protein
MDDDISHLIGMTFLVKKTFVLNHLRNQGIFLNDDVNHVHSIGIIIAISFEVLFQIFLKGILLIH